ncbi:MAG: O-antigen ligase family protein [Verrucomicrobia bacterium]|nr:O-antigen ligase family protein [Verrucomicrobiota bacterium]
MNSGGQHVFRLFEKVFVILALLLSTGIVLSAQVDSTGAKSVEGNPVQQAINLMNYTVVLLLLVFRAKRTEAVASRDLLLWMLLLLACVSVIWSPMPALTLRRSGALVGTTAVGLYLASRFSIGEQVRLLAKVLLLAAALSLAVILLWPERGVYGAEMGAHGIFFRGLFENKNVLGRLLALGALTMVFAFFNSSHRWIWCFGFLLCVGMLALCRSATAMVVLAAMLGTLPLLALLRWSYHLTLPLIVSAAVPGALAMAWMWANAETVFGVLGKDTTFTGRTDIWMAVMDMIWQRPWLGYGLNGFWLGWEGTSAYVCQIAGWAVPHAHNGFLDLWLAVGIWGLAIFVVGFALAFFRALAAMVRAVRASEGIWPVVYLLFMLLYNVTESTILRPHSIFWMLFVAAVFSRPAMRPAREEASAKTVVSANEEKPLVAAG